MLICAIEIWNIFIIIVIGQRNYLGSGFSTAIWKPLRFPIHNNSLSLGFGQSELFMFTWESEFTDALFRLIINRVQRHTRRWTGQFVTVILNWACISGSILPLNNLSQPLVVQRLDCAIQWIIKISCHWITTTKTTWVFTLGVI